MTKLESKIEAVLFFKGEAVSYKKLSEILKVSPGEIEQAVLNLKNEFVGRGVVIMEKGGEIMLGTAPELSGIIEDLQKEELNKELSRASLETLSIVLYKGEVTRAEIDYIRGVNSSFTLRALSVRGLVEKMTDKKDSRRYIYKPTFELLSYMGVKSLEELPDFQEVNKEINSAAQDLKNSSVKEDEEKGAVGEITDDNREN